MKSVFISYAFESPDAGEELARKVRDHFASQVGVADPTELVYLATKGMDTSVQSGERFDVILCNQIADSETFLLLLDRHSCKSRECLSELLEADALHKPIFPYWMDTTINWENIEPRDRPIVEFLRQHNYSITAGNETMRKAEAQVAANLVKLFVDQSDTEIRRRREAAQPAAMPDVARVNEAADRVVRGVEAVPGGEDPHTRSSSAPSIQRTIVETGQLVRMLWNCEERFRLDVLQRLTATALRAALITEDQLTPAMLDPQIDMLKNALKTGIDSLDESRASLREETLRKLETSTGTRHSPARRESSDDWLEPGITIDYNEDRLKANHLDLADFIGAGSLRHRLHRDGGPGKLLTPVLGTGTLQIRPPDGSGGDPDADVIDWDEAVERHCAESEDAQGDPSRSAFLKGILNGRSDGRTVRRTATTEEGVTGVRIALFDLAYLATSLFLTNLLEEPQPIADWEYLAVVLDPEQTQRLANASRQSAQVLDTLEKRNRDAAELLGARDLREKLEEYRNGMLDREGDPKPRIPLSGKRVEWITDVFWHSMIFDSPLYPHMDELVLQVSFIAGSLKDAVRYRHPLTRLEPPASVYRFDLGHFQAAVRKSVERGFHKDPLSSEPVPPARGRRALYAGFANVLMRDFSDRDSNRRLSNRPDLVPMALVTTYDLELERALQRSDQKCRWYHVALPVIARRPRSRRARLRWVVGTFASRGHRDRGEMDEDFRSPTDGWKWLDDMPEDRDDTQIPWKGPLVLKINGSPLHDLPDTLAGSGGDTSLGTDSPDGAVTVHHAVTLAESDFLQASRAQIWSTSLRQGGNDKSIKQGLPSWITRSLRHTDRYWLLAGHRLVDWNSRMQLFMYLPEHLRFADKTSAVAISKSFDPDRIRLLTWLGVEPVQGDLADLTERLNDYAERDPESRPVGVTT